ncbi:phosphotransferase family enzyme [Rathayibacter tanaceti]|uniref:Phosphotransferase n=2 Tax=Rathayibacter tanaceti TaxID=1671680 RepID=A0AAE6RI11_9MICO|nr:phosphotransferase [Rathayibacter tanaceti]QHC54386.1 phosphotransferase [Rathayibacter tanaceti]TCO38070.1 phosphotransferase family enzyme [Rathayibacter tanaceti]
MIASAEQKHLLDRIAPLLARLGRTRDEIEDAPVLLGRNLNARLRFSDGDDVFVKAVRGLGSAGRYQRVTTFHDVMDLTGLPVRTPDLLARDDAGLVLAQTVVGAESTFAERVRESTVSPEELELVAGALAAVHGATPSDASRVENRPPSLPPHGLDAMPIDLFEGSTMGQLEMWRLLQGDPVLRDRLDALVRSAPSGDAASPIHGDLRSDQILLDGATCWMLDWEDFRLGDPARDAGGLLGELFYHRARRLVHSIVAEGEEVTDASIIAHGGRMVDEAVPSLRTFWRAYTRARAVEEGFAARAVGFLGWQLFDRALASATYYGRMSAMDRALAGIGREAIVNATGYTDVLGLGAE